MDRKARRARRLERQQSKLNLPTVPEVAEVLALAPPIMPWKFEALARAWIRSSLCVQHVGWPRADKLAFLLVAYAREELGIRAPRGYDSDVDLASWIPSESCPICDRRFCRVWPEQVCCSTACARAHARNEAFAAARVGVVGPPRCQWCGSHIEFLEVPWQLYCGDRCYRRANALQSAEAAEPDLGIKIRNARVAKRLLQRDLAARLGIVSSYVTQIEAGRVPVPVEMRPKLFAALDLDEHGDPTEPLDMPVCPWCLEQLPADRRSDSKFCSQEHQRKWFSRQQGEKLKAKRAAARTARPCGYAGCSNQIPEGTPLGRKYCSTACTHRAFKARRREGGALQDAPAPGDQNSSPVPTPSENESAIVA
jgi:transcriptional regulator with XRE-family HTH domain